MPKKFDEERAGQSTQEAETNWHAITSEEAAGILGLGSDIRSTGLSTKEAKARFEQYGPNKLSEKEKKTLLQRIWAQVNNILVGILFVVLVVSLVKGIITTGESRITNFIEVGLIALVITYVLYCCWV